MAIAPQAARNTFKETRRVNLRVTERDYKQAHARAREEGIPYQTLPSSVIHKYLSGRFDREEMTRVPRLVDAPILRRRRASGGLGGEGGVCRRGQTLGKGVGRHEACVREERGQGFGPS